MKTESKVIGNHTYKVTALGALTGRKVFVLLLRLLGGAADSVTKANVPAALSSLSANLTDADLAYLCDTFAKTTEVHMPDGRRPQLDAVFDLHFSDNYLEMLQWLAFCLEVNFGSFFRGLADKSGNGASATPADKA